MNLDSGNPLWRLLPPRVLAQGQVLRVLFKITLCRVGWSLRYPVLISIDFILGLARYILFMYV